MCGIAGIVTHKTDGNAQSIIHAMVASQQSRGPDHQAITNIKTENKSLWFGHNRLSIIDLSDEANQPMWDVTGRYCIIYNGEIYNYLELREELINSGAIFNTKSDTEVILNAIVAWGLDALNRFNGPFAFALYDKAKEQLFLARDRFGKKPLYYAIINNSFYFSSTPKVIVNQLKLKPNLHYAARGLKYLVYEDDSDISPYEGLYSLQSAHYLCFDLRSEQLTPQIKKYYDLEQSVVEKQHSMTNYSERQLLDLLLETLTDALKIRLRADVPIGVSLSGGLDSTSVAALLAKEHKNIIGFSFAHPEESKSEGPLVKELAKHINIQTNYIWPSAKEIVQALIPTLQSQQAPFPGLSIIAQYLVYQRVRECGIKVLLGGQGGDEAFMGYRKYQLFYFQQLLRQKRFLASIQFLLNLTPMFAAELGRAKLYWQQRHRYKTNTDFTMGIQLPEASVGSLSLAINNELWQRQMLDVTRFSLPTLLRYEDRNSLGNSVESRLPFLDYRVIELGLALPAALKLRAGYGKWPVREIMKNRIPESIRTARYKRGFDVPMMSLVQAGLGNNLRQLLQDNLGSLKDYLPANSSIDRMFSDQRIMQRSATIAEAITLLWLSGVGNAA